jgi:hypothetical protein
MGQLPTCGLAVDYVAMRCRVHLIAGLNDIAHDDGADGLARGDLPVPDTP